MNHRGPDGAGVFRDEQVALGHRRLAIIDLSENGAQPMVSACGRWALVYNGELYNYIEIRAELEGLGAIFRSRSDTEVVMQAIIEWGDGALLRLNGMFAIGLWDRARRELLLARDRFGIKPLYWTKTQGGIVFASEIKALRACGVVSDEIAPQAVSEYLWYGNTLGAETLFADVQQLAPAHVLRLTRDSLEVRPYWRVCDVRRCDDDFETAKEKVRTLFDRAVDRHMLADVPVAAFLSGGIDSSAIVARAAHSAGHQFKTFSAGFDFDQGVNELSNARQVAEYFGTDHTELHVKGGELRSVVEALVVAHDQPFGDAANIPLYLMAKELRSRGVKVVLQGDGSDELFGGYRRYVLMKFENALRLAAHGTRCLGLKRALPRRLGRLLDRFREDDPALRMALLLTDGHLGTPPERILHEDLRERLAEVDPFRRYRQLAEECAYLDPTQRMLAMDCQIILPQTFLEKVDKSTMASSVEARVPFLDTELATYVISLPSHFKVNRGRRKYILREALKGSIPNEVLQRPKQGFGVPSQYWLRSSLKGYLRDVLFDPMVASARLFDRSVLESLVDGHLSGSRGRGAILWKALNLALWTVLVRSRAATAFSAGQQH